MDYEFSICNCFFVVVCDFFGIFEIDVFVGILFFYEILCDSNVVSSMVGFLNWVIFCLLIFMS